MALTVTYGTVTTVTGLDTTSMGAVAGGGTITSSAIDNSTAQAPAMKVIATFNWDASSTGSADLYLIESGDNSTFSTTNSLSDMRYIGTVSASTTSTSTKVLDVGNLPKYWKIHVVNNDATNGFNTASTVEYQTVTYTG